MFIVFVEQIFVVGSSFIDEVIILLLLPKLFLRKPVINRNRFILFLAGFIISALFSAIINEVPLEVTIAGIRSYIQYAFVFLLIISTIIAQEEFDRILSSAILIGIFVGLVGLINLLAQFF